MAATIVNAAMRNSPDHASKVWHSGLESGLRTALACFIVGCTTIYSPPVLREFMKFPAFAYVTATLIISEATLGDTLRGAIFALYGTFMAIIPAILSLLVVGPNNLSVMTTTLATVVGSFIVTLPASTPLITKRIALGQIVLVYVAAYKQGSSVSALMHPAHVAASTALGFTAPVLAVLLPYPRLAFDEVKKMSREFKKNEIERMGLYVRALCAKDRTSADAAISQASSKSKEAAKLLCRIKLKQGSLKWERPQFTRGCSQTRDILDMLQAIDMPLKGMEIALTSVASFPIKAITQGLKDYLHSLENQIISTSTAQPNKIISSSGAYEHIAETLGNSIPIDVQNIFILFSLFCMRLLEAEFTMVHSVTNRREKKVAPAAASEYLESVISQEASPARKARKVWAIPIITHEMLMVSMKCSMATGLAVLFGVLFSKDNGYWSGLTVAMAITPRREATFKLANLRAQGTALGSVYGVVASIISQNYMELRFLVLLPWIIFTSFLKQSQMYGQSGGITAAVSAIIILGRKNYGFPTIFAIARLSETCIGLLCCILVEIILQPTRASSLARSHLCHSIESLHKCMSILSRSENASATSSSELKEKGKKLTEQIHQLETLMKEAQGEPNFWFLPFPGDSYGKIHNSLSRMAEFIIFIGLMEQLLVQEYNRNSQAWHKIQETIKEELEALDKVDDLIMCLHHIMQVKPTDKKLQVQMIYDDLEMGEKSLITTDEKECQQTLSLYLQRASELVHKHGEDQENHDVNNKIILFLGSCGYCIGGLKKESRELEKGIIELVQLENPTRYINLSELSCKVKTVLAK